MQEQGERRWVGKILPILPGEGGAQRAVAGLPALCDARTRRALLSAAAGGGTMSRLAVARLLGGTRPKPEDSAGAL